jgi:dihydropyrimidinase
MVDAGICSFKLFMAYKGELMARDDALMACMERARDLNALTMVHAENGDVIDLLVTRALGRGDTSAINHALTRPEWVEAEATGRAVRFAEMVGAPVYIVHVSCERAAREVEAGQARGVPVSAETCIQYLFNSIDDLRRPDFVGARYVCSPPLRDAANHAPLWAFVKRGVLESVSTDHCPFTDEQKARGLDNFSLVPNGLALIQHRLAKLWDAGVNDGRMSRSELVARTSTTIAERFGLSRKGALLPGKDADVVVFDPAAPRDYGVANSLMNVDYDLYEGQTASASVRHTFSRGTLVYDRGQILTQPGHGRYVRRSLSPAAAALR